MYEALGFTKSAGLMAGLTAVTVLPVIALHFFGERRRRHEAEQARTVQQEEGQVRGEGKVLNDAYIEQATV